MNCAASDRRVADEFVAAISSDVTEDMFLGGALRLRQTRRGHRAGHDAILLAAATPAKSGQRIVEFGAGVGAAGLALARRVDGLELALVEIDTRLAELARGNAALNNITATVHVIDVTGNAGAFVDTGLGPDLADGVMMNPPFNDLRRHQASPDANRSDAHIAAPETLADWIHAARRLLKPGGVLTLIWRAENLADVLAALGKGFGAIAIKPVYSTPDAPAIRILVRAVKGSRAQTGLLPGLHLTSLNGTASEASDAVLIGGKAIEFE